MEKKIYSRSYAETIIKNSHSFKLNPVSSIGLFDESQLENKVLFWSVVPQQRHIPRTENGALNFLKDLTYDVHHQIVRHSVRNYKNRSRHHLHPTTYYFFEPEGARVSHKQNLYFLNTPHIHAVTHFHSEHSIGKINKKQAYENLVRSIASTTAVDSFKLKWFDTLEGNLTSLVDYCGKYAFKQDETNELPSPTYDIVDPERIDFDRFISDE